MWADLGPPAGRRPVCVLTRDAAIEVLAALACAPNTRTIRGIRSEVEIGTGEGLPETSVISCDNVITVPTDVLDAAPIGQLGLEARVRLDRALRDALDIRTDRRTPAHAGACMLFCMQSTSVRIDVTTHAELKRLAAELHTTVGNTVTLAVRALRQDVVGADLAAPLRDAEVSWLDADLG